MPSLLRTRFLVIGSGVAGLHTAWRTAPHGEVLILTKRTLHDSATSYAQGGIAAALGARLARAAPQGHPGGRGGALRP
jgi:L-aspartate oxidase